AGSRVIPAGQFFIGPLTTALRPGEMLTEIRIPAAPPRTGGAFVEMARRAGDFALVGVAALVTLDGAGRCVRARLALCGGAPAGGGPAGGRAPARGGAAGAGRPPGPRHEPAVGRPRFGRVQEEARAALRAPGARRRHPALGRALIMPTTIPIGLNVNGIRHEL